MIGQARERHAWLRGALADRGLRAKDVAQRWGVTDAVLSRFIKTGDPELSMARAQVLADMLGMPVGDLSKRIAEDLAPPPRRPEPEPEADAEPEAPPAPAAPAAPHTGNGVRMLLNELKECAERVRHALPGYRVIVRVELQNGETG
jgi:hypothetical protein